MQDVILVSRARALKDSMSVCLSTAVTKMLTLQTKNDCCQRGDMLPGNTIAESWKPEAGVGAETPDV